MAFRPTSRPRQFASLANERGRGDNVGTRTVAGSPEKAKLVVGSFMRGTPARDRAPSWGPDSRSFSEQRHNNPNAFRFWGDQLATTNAGYEFMAPAPEPQPFNTTTTAEDEP